MSRIRLGIFRGILARVRYVGAGMQGADAVLGTSGFEAKARRPSIHVARVALLLAQVL